MSADLSTQQPALGAYGVTYGYGARLVLREVSFELAQGEVLALLGPNGSGKSTLMKVVAGLLSVRGKKDCSAVVRHKGRDFLSEDPVFRARHVAYVPPDIRVEFPLTALETVMLGRTSHGQGLLRHLTAGDHESVRWAMEQCLCWKLRDRDLHTLSGGERQLVSLAKALAQGSRVLFLDEALSRMDLDHQAAIGRMLRKLAAEGWSVLLVSHDVNLASEWADTCLLLKGGERVAGGPVKETLTQEKVRALYPGADLVVGVNPATGAPKIFFGTGGGV